MADDDPPIESVFRQPFAQQVAFFRQKLGNLVPTRRWDDIWQEAHDSAFMVAGAAKADLLADLAGSVDQAISQGQTLDGFRKSFRGIIEKHGWVGFTGDDRTAQRPKGGKGLAWRTRVIYETNLITSYSAGRLAQLREAGYTWWIYRHSDFVSRPRPAHVALDGITKAADDPFWRTYYPPNGWGCRCRVVGARGQASIERLGGDQDKPLPDWVGQTNPKTGAPVGIDRGFAYQPGAKVADTVRALAGKLNKLPPGPSIAIIQDWLHSQAFARWWQNPSGDFPLARLPDHDAMALGAQPDVRVANMSAETARKQKNNHPEITAEEYAKAQDVISNATAKARDKASMIYIKEVKEEGVGGHVLVVKATATGQDLLATSFRRLSRKEAKRDAEISRLLRKEE